MKRTSDRRTFLTAAAASAVAVAGCSRLDGSPGGNDTSSTTTTTSNGSETPGNDGTPTGGDYPQTDRGEVIEDFEDLSEWGTISGERVVETQDVYRGSQSVRIQNPSGGSAGIYRSFPDGLDLSSRDLSIAAKLERPGPGKLAVEVIAPARSDHLVCRRYVPEAMDDWMRVDLGYTGKRGEPDLSNVQELRIIVLSDGEPINYVVDDLRAVPKPVDSGRVVLTFGQARASHYDVAFQELQKRGWAGMETVEPDEINSSGALTTGQLREMRDAGWDVGAYPANGTPLPSLSPDEKRRALRDTRKYLELKGFPDGKQFVALPSDTFDRDTLDAVGEIYEYGFTFGACPSSVPPVGRAAVSQVYGSDLNGAARMINLAAQYDQLTVINFPAIGENAPVPKAEFVQLLDIIEDWGDNLEVITPSELLALEGEL